MLPELLPGAPARAQGAPAKLQQHLRPQHRAWQGGTEGKGDEICKLELLYWFVIYKTLIQSSQPRSDVVLAHEIIVLMQNQLRFLWLKIEGCHKTRSLCFPRAGGSQRAQALPSPLPMGWEHPSCVWRENISMFGKSCCSERFTQAFLMARWCCEGLSGLHTKSNVKTINRDFLGLILDHLHSKTVPATIGMGLFCGLSAVYGNKRSRGEWGFWITLHSFPSWECSIQHHPPLQGCWSNTRRVKSCKSFSALN